MNFPKFTKNTDLKYLLRPRHQKKKQKGKGKEEKEKKKSTLEDFVEVRTWLNIQHSSHWEGIYVSLLFNLALSLLYY